MTICLFVFIGGCLGSALRHGVNLGSAKLLGTDFPYGILLINITGSIILGLLTARFRAAPPPEYWRLFFTLGLMGGFTTFSTFSLDVSLLWDRGAYKALFWYIALSVAVSIAGLIAALWIGAPGQ